MNQPVQRQASLFACNSLRVDSTAELLIDAVSVDELLDALDFDGPVTVLGGGTNVVLRKFVPGRVVKVKMRGLAECGQSHVRVGAGEIWHEVVRWTLARGLTGLENLALIPGLVGAAPFQNIGAYGRELNEVVDSVEVVDRSDRSLRTFSAAECRFGYRDSRFKSADADRYVVTGVVLDLDSVSSAVEYPDVQTELKRMGREATNAHAIAEAVIRVRRRKLPDPRRVGNVGSFFKNPVIDARAYDMLRGQLDIRGYPSGAGTKISAARLIDELGWKGHSDGPVGVWPRQPLVLTNSGGATGEQVLDLAARITESVAARFAIDLEREPVVVGQD